MDRQLKFYKSVNMVYNVMQRQFQVTNQVFFPKDLLKFGNKGKN